MRATFVVGIHVAPPSCGAFLLRNFWRGAVFSLAAGPPHPASTHHLAPLRRGFFIARWLRGANEFTVSSNFEAHKG